MSSLKNVLRLGKMLCGVGVVGGSVLVAATVIDEGMSPSLWSKNVFAATPEVQAPSTHLQKFGPGCKWDFNWDRREPSSLLKPPNKEDEVDSNEYHEKLKGMKATATRHILLVRHGQYNINNDNDAKRTLTNLGISQAVQTGERLAELGLPYKSIVHSTMTRATETAKVISESLPGVPMTTCELIREGAPYPPEPPSVNWKPEAKQFFEDGARIEAGFRKHIHRAPPSQKEDSYEVIVCHANVIRYYVCRALQLPPEAWLRMSLHNGSITWLVIRPSGRVALRMLGDVGFMPKHLMTTT